MNTTLGQMFWSELEKEAAASRKCLERMPDNLFTWKPHEKSMQMGYLALIVAEVPKWITIAIEKGEINFATWEKKNFTTSAELVKYFDDNMAAAKNVLAKVSDQELEEGMFYLKMGEKVLFSYTKKDNITEDIRHSAHHRGQLTVYMRLNNIAVPQIYGPSADESHF